MSELNKIRSNLKRIFFLTCLIFPIITSCFNSNDGEEINIFAAASLSGPLDKIKDNYKKSINIDYDGSLSINLGAYGIPETLLINNKKIVLLKFIGPLNSQKYQKITSNWRRRKKRDKK